MRNLKKILALALALVMTLSLMTVANAFNDDADIDETYAEAVEVLSGLGVFKGVNDGSNFAPKQTITRGEVAAIIYRIVTGDVTDTQASIYKDYAKFADVAENHWAAGYIGYCSNAELIVGDGTNFYPDQTVTGYQALAMILRALGYDQNDEFKGDGWEIRTASTAQQKGILKNINAGTLGTGASREMVAEILFQAIANTNMVYYLTNTMSYQDAGSTLGYKTFKLERIEGEITANEYADLYSGAALPAGKTELDGRVIDIATEITDIGESRYAYVTGSKVLTMADTGLNKVFETGAATKVDDRSTGMKLAGAAKYLNFAGGSDYEASDYKIAYVMEFKAANDDAFDAFLKAEKVGLVRSDLDVEYGKTENTYTREVSFDAGEAISSADLGAMKYIFNNADKEKEFVLGEVYVGTQSNRDVSDYLSYSQFLARYIETENTGVNYTVSDNGEWLKVVDNDGDGVAEYVFLTEFAMAQITDITKKGVYTFTGLVSADKPSFEAAKVESKDIVTGDELAEGDIVLYTLIDGKYYVDIANMVTETIDRHGIDSKTETITCDGTVYGQSHIGYSNLMDDDITEAVTEQPYDLYLDHFGYVRLYQVSTYNRGFVLLTDGKFSTDGRTDEYEAQIFDVDAEKLVDVAVAEGKDHTAASNFIYNRTWLGNEEGTWGRLLEAGQVYFGDTSRTDPFVTNIAAYAVDDGTYTLSKVEDASNRVTYSAQELKVVDGKTKVTDKTLYTTADEAIQATTDTVYYLVIKGLDGLDIMTWTGYANAPAEAVLDDGAVAYTVTLPGAKNTDYDVAQVVVFETDPVDEHSLYFVYRDKAVNDTEVYAIGYDEAKDAYDDTHADVERGGVLYAINFYNIYDSGKYAPVTVYGPEGIFAGETYTAADVDTRDYVKLAADENTSGKEITFYTDEVPAFVVSKDQKNRYSVDEQVENYEVNDKLIVVTNAKGDVLYVINVSQSLFDYNDNKVLEKTEIIKAVEDLYDAICMEADDVALDIKNNIVKAGTTMASYTYSEIDDEFEVTATAAIGYEFVGDLYATVGDESVKGTIAADKKSVTFDLGKVAKDSTVVLSGATAAIEYTITYTGLDGATPSAVSDPVKYTIENKAEVLAKIAAIEPTKDSYDFAGWEYTYADTTNELGNLTCNATWDDAYVTLTVECYDEDGNVIPGDWVNKEKLPEDKAATIEVTHAAKYSVNGEDKGYVLNGKITLPMDEDTVVVITYVDEYAVTIDKTVTDGHVWDVTFTYNTADASKGTLEFKVTDVASFVTARTASITGATFDGGLTQKTLDGSVAVYSYPVTLGTLTSDGYVINVTIASN